MTWYRILIIKKIPPQMKWNTWISRTPFDYINICPVVLGQLWSIVTYSPAEGLQACLYAEYMVLQQHFNQLEAWAWTGELQQLNFFLLRLGLISYCTIQFEPSFSRWTDGFTFDYRRLTCRQLTEFIINSLTPRWPGPMSEKRGRAIIIPPPLCFQMKCFFLIPKSGGISEHHVCLQSLHFT